MKKLSIHYFQHVPFEEPGYLENWALWNGHSLSSTKFYEKHELPDPDKIDWLIVMGGPMGVYDEEEYPWLNEEKKFIKLAIENDKTVIGICLGAQLIADVLGARVYPNTQKEIGWFSVFNSSRQDHRALSGLPDSFTAFHWHGDTFDLPDGATHLLESDVCYNQAFIYNDKVLALQFHLEVTNKTLGKLVDNCWHELVAGDFIQQEDKILEPGSFINQSNLYLKQILDNLSA